MTEATRFEMVAFVVRYILEILFDGSSQKKQKKHQKNHCESRMIMVFCK